jgi:hypothetical protein
VPKTEAHRKYLLNEISQNYRKCLNDFNFQAIRKNDTMWFAGKWMQLEDTMLSEISQVQKDKGCMFSLICGRSIQKIKMYTK